MDRSPQMAQPSTRLWGPLRGENPLESGTQLGTQTNAQFYYSLFSITYLKKIVEMIGGEQRRREAGDQGREHERDKLAPAPKRKPRAERGCSTRRNPRNAALIGGDERERRRKRHLETWMHHRLRRHDHDGERGNRERAQRQRLAVEYYAEEHDCGHDEGALGRDLCARQDEIERRGKEGSCRRPFLDCVTAVLFCPG